MILPNRNDMKWIRIERGVHCTIQKHIFERVGIMLHGKHSFCTKLASIIKHGGGKVFKTLQWLLPSTDDKRTSMRVIVVEDKSRISRHLSYCALEQDIPIMPCSWIIKSLYSGKLLPFKEENNTPSSLPFVKVPSSIDMSQEI
ncbi:putative BRCT domain-containing protein [Lupinus albus]|uniref:Putative BRCT domain-containing protein n=1 Tax=Lupinus albus TaxID=3870 RepID=A0A6A4NIR8_LUPAL|nr:putative BRCT domain-containing protein [Lupinus albus]